MSVHALPKGWGVARVKGVVKLVNGFAFKPTQWKNHGLPIIRIQNLNDPLATFNRCPEQLPEKFRVRPGDLLFAWSGTPGTSFGAHIWRGEEAWLNQHIFRVDFDRTCFVAEFLRLAINQNLSEYVDQAHGGAGLAHITKGRFESSEILVAPLAEQRRIVAKIEALQARTRKAREALDAIPPLLEQFRQSVLAAAFRGDLTAEWREQHPDVEPASALLDRIRQERRRQWEEKNPRKKYAEPEPVDDSELPELPAGWVYARAEELVAPGTVITYGIVLPGDPQTEGVPYIRGQDIENGQILVDQLWKTTHEIAGKHERSTLREGDVLLCIIRHLKVAIVPPGLDGANLTQGTVRLRPSQVMTGPYLAGYLDSPIAQGWMKERYFGMAMPRINVEDARAIPVPVAPMEEQREISDCLGIYEQRRRRVLAQIQRVTDEATQIDQSILAKAFRGELVAQDPNDESASMLLGRMRPR